MLSSRRMAYIAAVLVIGLSACGSASNTASPAGTAAAASPPVIHVEGSSAGGGYAPAPMAAEADSAANDSKMMAGPITYVYDGEAIDLTAPATAWYFDPASSPTEEQIAALAATLGVEGDVRQLGDDRGGGWMVGPDDYSTPTLYVGSDATQTWSYSPGNSAVPSSPPCELYPPGDPAGDFGDSSTGGGQAGADASTGGAAAPDAAPQPADGTSPATSMPVCAEPTPPANVPDEATAESKAKELFQSFGLDAGSYEFETYADEWSASVTAYLVLDGIRTNMAASVGFGAEGALTWASGYLATPQRGADYPRIGIDAAVQRLNDQSSSWMGLETDVARGAATDVAVASDDAATSEIVPDTAVTQTAVAPAPDADTSVVAPGEGVCLDDTGAECAPISVDPITVTLSNPRPSLEQLWASDDTVWLLPGYAFDAADGGIYSVLAVEDKYIEVTAPTEVPVPEIDVPAVDPGVDPASPPPTTMAIGDVERQIIGLQIDEAIKVAEGDGWTLRVVRVDGADQPVTADYSPSRINVATVDGAVTEVVSEG